MMKIAIIDPSCFTMPYDHCLCEALVDQKCEVIFISSRYLYDNWNYQINYQRVNFFYNVTNWFYGNKPVGFLRKEIKGFEHVLNMYNLVNYLKKLKPTIIHFQWVPFPFFDNRFIKILKNIRPVVATVHDVFPYHNAPSSKIQLAYFNSILKQFDHFIVHTQSSFKIITKNWGIPEKMVSIIPHGIFYHYKWRISPKENSRTKKQFIVFFGAIKPYKGLDILIQAFAKLPKDILEKSTLLIAGTPKMDINQLKMLAESLDVGRYIEWHLEFIPEDKVGNILKKAAIFVLPYNNFEAQSGALMALLPFGKPIIATKIACFTEILQNGKTGYLVEPQNPIKLTNALENVLSNPLRQEAMGRAVQQLARKFVSWHDIAQRTVKVYEKLILELSYRFR